MTLRSLVAALLLLSGAASAQTPARPVPIDQVQMTPVAASTCILGKTCLWMSAAQALTIRKADGTDTTAGGGGGVTTVAGTAPITCTGTTAVTCSLDASGITAATYGSPTTVPVCAYSAKGLATSCTDTAIAGLAPSAITGTALVSAAIGSTVQPLDADLTALAAFSCSGVTVRTGSGTWTCRTITGGGGISISNGDGVSGAPTLGSTFGGDIVGSVAAATVGGIQGAVVSNTPPSAHQVLAFESSAWTPTSLGQAQFATGYVDLTTAQSVSAKTLTAIAGDTRWALGDVVHTVGPSDSTASNTGGGGFFLVGGAGGPSDGASVAGNGGSSRLTGGAGGAGNSIRAAGAGGSARLTAGPGGLSTASVPGGNGGQVLIAGGTGGPGSAAQAAGNGAASNIDGGPAGANGGGGGANGGAVVINGGAASGVGTAGAISIGATTCSAISVGNVSCAATFAIPPICSGVSAPAATAMTITGNAADGGDPLTFNSGTAQTGGNNLVRFRNAGINRWMFRVASGVSYLGLGNGSGSEYMSMQFYESGTLAISGPTNFAPLSDATCTLGDDNRGWSSAKAKQWWSHTVNTAQSTATATLNAASGSVHLVTLTSTVTSWNITNCLAGQEVLVTWIQNSSGGPYLLSGANANIKFLPSTYLGADHGAPVLTITASARDSLVFKCESATRILEVARNFNN